MVGARSARCLQAGTDKNNHVEEEEDEHSSDDVSPGSCFLVLQFAAAVLPAVPLALVVTVRRRLHDGGRSQATCIDSSMQAAPVCKAAHWVCPACHRASQVLALVACREEFDELL